MFDGYRNALRLPGALAFSAAGALARLPMSMYGIGLVLLVEAATGSYALAGAVAGVFAFTNAVVSPPISRAVDRYGQARVLLPATAVHLVGLTLLVLGTELGAPTWSVIAAAALAGGSVGSIGALIRARWSFVAAGRPDSGALLHSAYSLESVVDEAIYITGPLLVTWLATQLSPVWGIAVGAVAVGAGSLVLSAQRRTQPHAARARTGPSRSVLASPGMVVLVVSMICVGTIFGSVEVLTVAFADERGHLASAGWVLAGFALGSLLAGLGYGAVHWRAPAHRRFVLSVLVLAAGVVPTLFVQTIPQLAVVVFVAGFGIAPMLIGEAGLVQELVEPARLTEGLTWNISGIVVGVSAGAAIAGAVVDAAGASRGFVVPVFAGVLASAVVLLSVRWLRPAPERTPPPVPNPEKVPVPMTAAPIGPDAAPR